MRNLLLEDLLMGLRNLFSERATMLRKSAAGRMYEPLLIIKHTAIGSLPEELITGRPMAQELSDKDQCHDAFGAALFFINEAYLRLGSYAPPEALESAKRIRANFVTSLAELKASYPTEIAAVYQREPKLDTLKEDLESLPVAGGTLLDWAKSYVAAGKSMDDLISHRAQIKAQVVDDRSDAGTLRPETIGLLNRLRTAMADELDADPTLQRNIIAEVFGYFDELAATRDAANAPKSAVAPAPAVQPPSAPPIAGVT